MLTLILAILSAPAQTAGPVRPLFRTAVLAVIDSASNWSRTVVGAASQIIVDRTSFQEAAARVGSTHEDWADFAGSIRAGAEDRALDQAKICTTEGGREWCTLAPGTIVVRAESIAVRGPETVLTIAVRWRDRRLMGRAVYTVVLQQGRIKSITPGLRT